MEKALPETRCSKGAESWGLVVVVKGEGVLNHSLLSLYPFSLTLNILFKEKKTSINNFMCIIIPHKDDSTDVFQAQFLCRIAENAFILLVFH